MKKNKFQSIALCFFLISALGVFAQPRTTNVNQKIVIDWHQSQPKGSIEVVFGQLVKLNIIKGEGKIKDNSFEIVSHPKNYTLVFESMPQLNQKDFLLIDKIQ